MEKTKKQGMKWFHFLIYFWIWLKVISNVFSGISYLIRVYNKNFILFAEELYTSYPVLQHADLIVGVVSLLFAILFLVARFRLAKFKKGAPALYIKVNYTILFLNVVFSTCLDIVNFFASETAMQASPIHLFLISTIVSAILTFALNFLIYKLQKIYFKKREHLFVN